jgi:hypothetical protein
MHLGMGTNATRVPWATLRSAWLWLELDRYPSQDEVERLARGVVPDGMQLEDWSLSPQGQVWLLAVQCTQADPLSELQASISD